MNWSIRHWGLRDASASEVSFSTTSILEEPRPVDWRSQPILSMHSPGCFFGGETMKVALRITLVLGLLALLPATGFGQSSMLNTAHDLSVGSTNTLHVATGGTIHAAAAICEFCHTPHGGIDTATWTGGTGGGLLWNRAVYAIAAPAWSFYTSDSLNAPAVAATDLGPQSLACLSCHDGSLALDSLVNAEGSGHNAANIATWTWTDTNTRLNATKQLVNGPAALSRDLSNDHPIGFDMSAIIVADGGLDTIANAEADGVKFYGGGGNIECASCHNPHDDTNGLFLRASNTDSALCVACHTK